MSSASAKIYIFSFNEGFDCKLLIFMHVLDSKKVTNKHNSTENLSSSYGIERRYKVSLVAIVVLPFIKTRLPWNKLSLLSFQEFPSRDWTANAFLSHRPYDFLFVWSVTQANNRTNQKFSGLFAWKTIARIAM